MIDTNVLTLLTAMLGVLLVILLVYYIIMVIAQWRIFAKAGQPGWKSIIPFYNSYILYKIVWQVKWFWIVFGLGILSSVVSWLNMSGGNGFLLAVSRIIVVVAFILSVFLCSKTAKAYGKGIGFTVGLVLLHPIFMLILAFGSAEYVGAQE